VPAYNAAAHVGTCLRALTAQQLSSIEILALDDGSTDETLGILQAAAAADGRIQVLSGPNRGVYQTRNIGLDAATGRFVAFVDADDLAHPALLSTLLSAAEAHAAEVSFCDVEQAEPSGEVRLRESTQRYPPDQPLSLSGWPVMVQEGFTTLWGRLYRRDFLEAHRLRLDARYRISADMLFLQRVLRHATTIVRAPAGLYRYRIGTPDGLTSYTVRNELYRMHLEITIELVDYWVREGLLGMVGPHALTLAVRNLMWNTHIDPPRLAEVFHGLHQYLTTIPIEEAWLAAMPRLEARVLGCLRADRFGRFMVLTASIRRRTVAAKGGVHATWPQRLSWLVGIG
jgi:glycosyltransferase involved in cell wall biosynthesis